MSREVVTDLAQCDLRSGDRVLRNFFTTGNFRRFDVSRKVPKAAKPTGYWAPYTSDVSVGTRLRATAPDGSCTIEYDAQAIGKETFDDRRKLLGALPTHAFQKHGWTVEMWVEQ